MKRVGPEEIHHEEKIYFLFIVSTAVPSYLWFCIPWCQLPGSTVPWKRVTLVLIFGQRVSSGLMLSRDTYVIHPTSSPHVGISPSHIITRKGHVQHN